MSYLTFVLRERRLLTFGVSLTFFSSFGQTFLIALFVPFFLDVYQLSNSGFGLVYSAATLSSALILPWLGQWIDRVPLRWYSLWVAVGLMAASLMVMVSWHISVLFMAIALLRLCGQGLSGHTAQTSMARFYDRERGKALSVSSLGYPLGEALLPLAVATLLTLFHWRVTWGIIAFGIGAVLIPVLYLLVGRTREGRLNPSESDEAADSAIKNYEKVFSDNRIWYVIPAVLMPPFWITGLFLYQIRIGSEFGWTASLIATAFIFFALARTLASIGVGPAIDRFSARTLFPFYLLPMALGFLMPVLVQADWVAFFYMALFGTTMGFGSNVKSALWAELYGTGMIGTVRSLISSLMVLSTAVSPFLVGWMLDADISMVSLLILAIASIAASTLLAFRVHPWFDPK
ncbi:MAG: MFS transporter [Balneolaceae bacterium]